MDKELSLIFEFKTAPEDLKLAAQAHRVNSIKLMRSQAQNKKLSDDLAQIQRDYEESAKAFRVALKAWEPTGAV
jgi:hypothetical protein